MKVLYDVTKIGEDHLASGFPTGISRVVENLAVSLADSSRCDLKVCSTSHAALYSYAKYRRAKPKLKRISALQWNSVSQRMGRRIMSRFDRLNREIEGVNNSAESAQPLSNHTFKRLQKKIRRRLLIHAVQSLDSQAAPLNRKDLAHVDIFHSPARPLPESTQSLKHLSRVLTIYDLIPFVYPRFFTPDIMQVIEGIVDSLRPDDWVCAISHSTKDDLCNYRKFDPAQVFVTPLAADPDVFYRCQDKDVIHIARQKYGIPEGPYILSVCTLEPRKNIDHVIRCFVHLANEQNVPDLNLVLVGVKGWLFDKIFEELKFHDALRKRIVITGYAADEDLAAIYSGALAFAYPSFYEGFGLPPLEAMQCGIPVITSNTSSLPEVVDDAGIMLDPTDVDGMCQALWEIYRKPEWRQELSARSLHRASQFSWGRCANDTIDVYQKAVAAR